MESLVSILSKGDKAKVIILTQPEVVDTVGGAITSFINISNYLADYYSVYGVCYSKKKGKPKLSESVKFINLYDFYNEKLSFSSAINKLIETINPQIILFFFPSLYVNANLNAKFKEIPRILLFRSRPDFYFAIDESLSKRLEDLYVNTTTQILFPSYKKLLPAYIRNNSVVCIPNPTKQDLQQVDSKVEHKRIVYLSRIDCWKGHYFLIKSFSLIAQKYPDWSLDIYGQSQPLEEEISLKKFVSSLKLEKQINFCGVTKNPFETYLKYDFCVFPSYFEGFPLGLAEALSVGLPGIGLKQTSGVNELIIDGQNGFLCDEDSKLFAKKMEFLICDKNLRKKFSSNAINSMKKYCSNKILKKWKNLIDDILSNKEVMSNEIVSVDSSDYALFPINKIISMQKSPFVYHNFEKVFSIKKLFLKGTKYKIITILGIKFSIKIKRGIAK